MVLVIAVIALIGLGGISAGKVVNHIIAYSNEKGIIGIIKQ